MYNPRSPSSAAHNQSQARRLHPVQSAPPTKKLPPQSIVPQDRSDQMKTSAICCCSTSCEVHSALVQPQRIPRTKDQRWVRSFVSVQVSLLSVHDVENLTLKYSFVASWYSLFIVLGLPLAKKRRMAKMTHEMPMMAMVPPKTLQPSPGGVCARGPWAPKAM